MNPSSIREVADDAVIVSFGDAVTPGATERIRRLATVIASAPPNWIRNWRPAYTTVLVDFDPAMVDVDDVRRYLEGACASDNTPGSAPGRVVEVPVCYEAPYAPDMADVAAHLGLAPDDVVARHTAGRYPVLFLGFCPGFAYLDGLEPALATPR
ncbi:MAG TPA: carboxyltransferase domain-containing protein, partial [Candidatus Eisenbacteria bacterium]